MDNLMENGSNTVRDVVADEQDKKDISNVETYEELIWEYELSRGRWIKYENAINKKLK